MLRFWIIFLVSLIGFYFLNATAFYDTYIENPVLNGYANLTAGLLNIFNYDIQVDNKYMSGKLFSMSIATGCDALGPMFILLCGIVFYPFGSIKSKLSGFVFGIALIFVLNLIRLISLYLIGVYANSWFDFFHLEFWQALFIVVAIIYFFYWLKYFSH